MFKYYTGIGSRETPQQMCITFTQMAGMLEKEGWTLRSGGANGADLAFESGAKTAKEIYLPWAGFNQSSSTLHNTHPDAFKIARRLVQGFDDRSQGAQKLHARNIHQVLGRDLKTPASFVLCWTENGETKGGTATAIKLAQENRIPVLNFGKFKQMDLAFACKQFMQFYDFHVVAPSGADDYED